MHFSEDEKQKIKLTLFIITCSILIYALISKLPVIAVGLKSLMGMVSPFLIAIMVSFIINMPLSLIERKLLDKTPLKKGLKRFLAILLSYILVFALLVLVFYMIIPQLYNSVRSIVVAMPSFLERLSHFVDQASWLGPLQKPLAEGLQGLRSTSLSSYLWRYLSPNGSFSFGSVFQSVIPTINAVFSGFLNAFLVFVFSIYMLSSKETLSNHAKQLLYATFPEAWVDSLMYVSYTAYDNFYNFFTGQFREAVTLGFMTFVGMTLLRMDLALAISVLIAFGALIPMVGAVLAGIIGTLILCSLSLTQGLGFLVFIVVLQQFDGNIIYPRIVGQSVGIPPIWVLLAVIIGGSLLGVLGMLVFIPIFSTIYDLLSDFKTRRLTRKNINVATK